MNSVFFSSTDVRQLISDYSSALKLIETEDDFEKKRNELLIKILENFLNKPEQWDEKADYNIQMIGNAFIQELEDKKFTKESINRTFSTCFRFCLEPSVFSNNSAVFNNLQKQIKDFGIYNYNNFDDRSKEQLDYALKEMPTNIARYFFGNENISTFRQFNINFNEAKKYTTEWKTYFEKEQEKIEAIKQSLKGYESAFNFVGLYDGFNSLWKQKKEQIKVTTRLLIFLSLAIPMPLLFEFFFSNQTNTNSNILTEILTLLPFISLTIILIYYFRVVLQNYSSLRAQILQIELRRSLCQFIQSYSDYSKQINDGNPGALSKFEDIIFSNIMPSDEKVPSTFDGLEQIASLLNAIKPK